MRENPICCSYFQACDCSLVGSSGTQCHPVSGQCSCSAGHFGQKCDRCPPGYFDFPTCTLCQCDVRGTVDAHCKDGMCSCDATTGQCPCKVNWSRQLICIELEIYLFGQSYREFSTRFHLISRMIFE